MNKLYKAGIAAVAVMLALSGCSSAQGEAGGGGDAAPEFPTKDIRLVVPWAPGGTGDLTARTMQPLLEEELGVKVIVENMPGANGSIAYYWLADQKPDGYSLSLIGAEVSTLQYLDYDLQPSDYAAVAQATQSPGAVAVPVDSPFETIGDLIEYSKENPGKLTFGNPGPGSIWDATGNGLMDETGVKWTSVPFDGEAPSIQAAVQKDVDFVIAPIATIKPRLDEGLLRVLATLTDEPALDGVPTAKQEGIELSNASFIAVAAPKGTPEDVLQILSDAIGKATESDEFVKVLEKQNIQPKHRNPQELAKFLQEEADRYGVWIR